MGSWVLLALVLGFAVGAARASEPWSNGTRVYSTNANSGGSNGAFVGLTLIQSAAARGAVCLDGSLPGYHLHRGSGSGSNNWLVNLEGGGWCNDVKSCVFRKSSRRGSSNHMEQQLQFTGIMSNRPEENPDFYNWNRVKVRYCDGGSFTGDGTDAASGLYFRGQRIWQAAMDDLMIQGMRSASQALLSGCSAGGASTILHCDEFRRLFPSNTRVKCLADAGMFLDAVNIAGRREMREFFNGIVRLQGSGRSLPRSCTSRMDKTSCFFPQNVLPNIQTPTFILNTAYDVWQLQESLAPKTADPQGLWQRCKQNYASCNGNQLQFLNGQGRMGYLSTHVLPIARAKDRIHGTQATLLVLVTRELLKQSVTGSSRGATPSTLTVRTLVMARAITSCSGGAIFKIIILSHHKFKC